MENKVEKPKSLSEYDQEFAHATLFCNHFILDQAVLNAGMAKDELAKKGKGDKSFRSMEKVVAMLEKSMKLMEEVEESECPDQDD